jgi:hypothetical protein
VLPGVPDYIGKIISPTPTSTSLVYNTELKPRYERENFVNNLNIKYQNKGLLKNEIDSLINTSLIEFDKKLENEKKKYIEYFDSKIQGQVFSSVGFAIISPYSSFILAGNEVAGTGISSQVHFQKESQKFSSQIREYFDKNDLNMKMPTFNYVEAPIQFRILAAALPFISLFMFHIILLIMVFRAMRRSHLLI